MNISVIIPTCNRPDYLRRTVAAWRDYGVQDAEIVIADDGSDRETRKLMAQLAPDAAIFSPVRRGLGANLNRACAVARGDYHLILQDDFELTRNIADDLRIALATLAAGKCDIFRLGTPLDALRFYPPGTPQGYPPGHDPLARMTVVSGQWPVASPDPATRTPDPGPRIPDPGSRTPDPACLVFARAAHKDAWIYSDNPHVRRADFLKKFGRYDETFAKMADCETEMRDRCNARGIVAAWRKLRETEPAFDHIGVISNRMDRGF
jgi:glycosyltransferase involved in cell wall biosynthesis